MNVLVILEKYGTKNWRYYVADTVERLKKAMQPDEAVLGGGNVHKLQELPPGCRLGENANAFKGGFRLWTTALSERFASRGAADYQDKVLSAMRFGFGGHVEKTDEQGAVR